VSEQAVRDAAIMFDSHGAMRLRCWEASTTIRIEIGPSEDKAYSWQAVSLTPQSARALAARLEGFADSVDKRFFEVLKAKPPVRFEGELEQLRGVEGEGDAGEAADGVVAGDH